MLYLGSQEKGFYITDVATHQSLTAEFSGEATHIKQHLETALSTTHQYIVIYVDQYIDTADIIADTINQIRCASNAEIIIDACGLSPNSELIFKLKNNGYEKYVFGVSLGRKTDELETALNQHKITPQPISTKTENNNFFPENVTNEAIPASTISSFGTYKSIAVAGCCSRIGTTTQAIQIAKYYQFKGYKTCYIEANNNNFVKKLPEIYEKTTQDISKGLINCKSLDMFYTITNIHNLSDYDYCVYDFGEYGSQDFQELAYIDKHKKIIIGGLAPNEIQAMTSVLQKTFNDNISYIFSFIDKSEQNEVRKLMSSKSALTYFSNYTPQAFNLTSDNIKLFDTVFNLPTNDKSHKSFFDFLRRY